MSEAFFDWDLRSAEARFQRAYEINPNDFNTLSGYIYYLWIVGRFEDCMELQRQALLLDPLAFDIGTDMAFTLFNARRYQESIDQVLSLLPLDPDRWAGHTILAGSYSMAGRHEDAVNSAEWLIARGGEDQQSLAVATWALGLAGHDQRAREISDRLSGLASDYWVDPVYEAIALGGLGEIGQALDKLEQGYEERSVLMTWIGVSPFFDPLRDEPRFQELMQRMNFPE